jgi:hypothetical protein
VNTPHYHRLIKLAAGERIVTSRLSAGAGMEHLSCTMLRMFTTLLLGPQSSSYRSPSPVHTQLGWGHALGEPMIAPVVINPVPYCCSVSVRAAAETRGSSKPEALAHSVRTPPSSILTFLNNCPRCSILGPRRTLLDV